MGKPQEHLRLLPFYLLFVILTILSADHIFFWDTVQLGSMHAHHFYEKGLDRILLPDKMDSGHIPAFGMYLAFWWKILGKELWVSHLAMLPFLLGIVWQANRLLHFIIPEHFTLPAMVLFLAEPTLLAQSVLISPDIPLVFFFLLSLNGIFRFHRYLLGLGIAGLFLISMRGLMVAFALLLFDIYYNSLEKGDFSFSRLRRMSLAYLPSVFIILPYFLYHQVEKGWFAYHPASPWAESFERVDFFGFLYNIGIMGWRILDFGRIFIGIGIIVIMLTRVGKIKLTDKYRALLILGFILSLCLGYSFTTYKYLSAHRYLLPLFLMILMVFIYMLFVFVKSGKIRRIIYVLSLAGLLSGHFWIYPEGISQGWDASLAHWPYYELREKMNRFLEERSIPYSNVAAEFPNTAQRRFMELSESEERHQYLNLDSNKYVLYSNIYNNIDDAEIERIKSEYDLLKSFEKRGVFIELRIKP